MMWFASSKTSSFNSKPPWTSAPCLYSHQDPGHISAMATVMEERDIEVCQTDEADERGDDPRALGRMGG